MLNNIRFDLSDYLIHFFRNVDQSSEQGILFPEHARFNNVNESHILDSLFLLRCALRHHTIFSTWSYRNGKPTIYGREPAVCLTDMPLAAFVQSSRERLARRENVGTYAFMLPKEAMFALGARPAIYGLSQPAWELQNTEPFRILPNHALPLGEQYRYVAYNIGDDKTIDWTHEREWRWPYRGNRSHYEGNENGMPNEYQDLVESLAEMPGLDLRLTTISGAGVLVQDREDVPEIVYDILTLVDSKLIHRSMFTFVIPLCDVEQHGEIQDPGQVSRLINQHSIDLQPYFSISPERVNAVNEELDSLVEMIFNSGAHTRDDRDVGFGKSWVWIPDIGSELVRALIATDRIIISTDGRYLLEIDGYHSFPDGYEEHYCKMIANSLTAKYGVNASYFTVRNSESCNGIPNYTDFQDFEHPFYNITKFYE